MKAAAIELPHRFGKVMDQLALTDELLGQARASFDLALLPECALTGYVSEAQDFDLSAFAEALDGPTAQALAGLAKKHGVALAGPLIERDGARLFNACVVFDAKGRRIAHYRKRNPWMPETWATPGDLPNPVFTVARTRCTIAICFDVHFLARDAAGALAEADVLLFPSAWVDDGPDDARAVQLPEVARDFEVGVVNANWGLGTPRIRGQGGSQLIGVDGDVLRVQ